MTTAKTKTEKKTLDGEAQTVTVDDTQRKVTFGYTRKKNLGNYESEEVSVYLTDAIPADEPNVVQWLADHADPAMAELKVQTWLALGLPFGFNDAGEPVLDTPPVAPPRPIQQPQPHPAAQGAPKIAPAPRAPAQKQRRDNPSVAQVGYYAEEPSFCGETYKGGCGEREFYDNRADVDAKIAAGEKIGPDFKCKNCGKGGWRPGSYDYNEAIKSGGMAAPMAPPVQPQPAAGSGYGPDEEPW